MGTLITKPMGECGEFLFFMKEWLTNSEYDNKVSRHMRGTFGGH